MEPIIIINMETLFAIATYFGLIGIGIMISNAVQSAKKIKRLEREFKRSQEIFNKTGSVK